MSTAANWVSDLAPAATDDSLVFDGTTNLNPFNDSITQLATPSITFAAGAGSFDVTGFQMTVGSSGAHSDFVVKDSPFDQTISAPIRFPGGLRDRRVILGGGGTLTLSGDIHFSNDWLFPTTAAGTIVLSGNNTGDGKGSVINAGTNTMRAVLRNNVANTILTIGSDTALGNPSYLPESLRGIVANQLLTINTIGDRDLSPYTIAINTPKVFYNGADDMTIGTLISQGGNRDFWVTGTGAVTVANNIYLSADQTGRTLYLNVADANQVVINGVLNSTFHSDGLTSGASLFRKAGAGSMILNGDSSAYTGGIQVDLGRLTINNPFALGATGPDSTTRVLAGATLDLNGQTIAETLYVQGLGVDAAGALVNGDEFFSANITEDIVNPSSFSVGGAGDINVTRIRSTGTFVLTKQGSGVLTTSGEGHNNLLSLVLDEGEVVFANTSGYGADRGVVINEGTLKLAGSNPNLINDAQPFTMNGGVFDLNGKAEAIAAINGAGGVVTNSAAGTTASLFLGGGASGESSAGFSGVISDGVGAIEVIKEGTGTQTFTAANSYTGITRVAAGTLAIDGDQSLANGPVTVNSGGTLGGGGTVGGSTTIESGGTLAPGNTVGILGFGNGLTLEGNTTLEIDGFARGVSYDAVDVTGPLAYGGALTLEFGTTFTADQTLNLFDFDRFSGSFESITFSGSYTGSLLNTSGIWSGTAGGNLFEFVDGTGVLSVTAGSPTDIVIDVPGGTQTQAEAGYPTIGSATSLTKTGGGTLVFDAANGYTGPTAISGGTLLVSNPDGIASTAVTIDTGATLAVSPGVTIGSPSVLVDGGSLSASTFSVSSASGIASLAINAGTIAGSPTVNVGAGGQMALAQNVRVAVGIGGLQVDASGAGGRLDVGSGVVSIAAGGITAADLRADLVAGRAGGSWTGATGIISSAAAASGGTRAVGYVVTSDGAAAVSFAAPGDVDLSGQVNVFDLVGINSSGKYGSGTASVWSTGDFNYDGVTNVFDLVATNTAGVYGQGNYFPAAPTSAANVAPVPEPNVYGLIAIAIGGLSLYRHLKPDA